MWSDFCHLKLNTNRKAMKTIITLILIFVVSTGGFAQQATSQSSISGSTHSGIAISNFTITKVYPNPVKDFVTVDIHSVISGELKISLFNILGTEVRKWESFDLNYGDQQLKIDLSFLKTGVYILKISSSKQVCSQVFKKN